MVDIMCKFNGTVSQAQSPSGTKFNTPTPTHPPASPSSPPASSPSETQPESSIVSASHVTSSKVSMRLQVRTVLVAGRTGAVEANILFDTGADRSYISRDLVKRIGPECVGSQYLAYSAFGTGKSSGHELRNVFAVDAKGIHGSCETLILTEVPQICAPIFQTAVSEELIRTLQSLGVTDVCNESSHMQVDILLGLDCYWKFMSPKLVTVSDGLVAQETVFGWIVSGPVHSFLQSHSILSLAHSLLCLNDLSDDTLHCFWDLESIGVSDCPVETKHPVLTEFQEKVTFSDGRYHVGLPWKPGFRDKLQGNEVQAKCRLDRMTLKMEKTPSLAEEYHKCVQDMLASGIVEVVPEAEMVSASPVFYLPHRPVVKSSSLTTKVRPVFDASSAGPNGVSLNDCHEVCSQKTSSKVISGCQAPPAYLSLIIWSCRLLKWCLVLQVLHLRSLQKCWLMLCHLRQLHALLQMTHRNLSCQHVLPNLLLQILWDPREISPLCCLTLSVGGHSRKPSVLWRGVCDSYTMWNLLLLMKADWLVILPTMSWPRLRPVCSRMIREGTSVRNWLFWAGMNLFLLLHPLPVWVHTWGQMG